MIPSSNSSAARPHNPALSQAREAYRRKAREVELLDTPTDAINFRIKDAAWCSVVSGGIMAVGLALIASEMLWPRDAKDAKDSKLGQGVIAAGINGPVFFRNLHELGDALNQRSQQRALRSREVEIRSEFAESIDRLVRGEREASVSDHPESQSEAGSSIRRRNHHPGQGAGGEVG